MSIPDPVALLITSLKATSAVTAIASTRVYGFAIPPSIQASMPEAAVVVSPSGGAGRRMLRVRNNRIDTTCYGATLPQAWQLHQAVRESLEVMVSTGTLKSAVISSEGSPALDPVTQWPTCYASYTVLSATEA